MQPQDYLKSTEAIALLVFIVVTCFGVIGWLIKQLFNEIIGRLDKIEETMQLIAPKLEVHEEKFRHSNGEVADLKRRLQLLEVRSR